ncbi:polymeric immunoglobulin receptor-like isoform X4 [Triplophysa dalaica]|uniref:polymeric immunoglobulin receptor-like isoform X4 n=1 Tax=Triplophysa dalaica TaxID=1582913 RepID=UPI0024DFB1B6|nr:polymeric immunoglobulin receptor-like isoform X4 [Triplophysa dalaica]
MVAYGKAALFCTLICFCLISGTECLTSGSNNTFTVQRGGSVTIPCYYDSKYTQQRKFWFSEADNYAIYTNFTSETVSVIDHPAQSLFTMTMRNLKMNQYGEFYCFVETYEGNKTTYEGLLEIKNAPDVSVVSSSVSGDEGGNISVKCLYSSAYKNKHKQWCRYKDKSCYTSQNSSVQISDDERESFTVLMSGLMLSDSGWYFCSVGDRQAPVQLTVTAPDVSVVSSSVSGDEGGNISVKCLYSSAYKNKHKHWCRYKDKSCYTSQSSSVQISDDERESFTVLMSGLMLSDSGWYFCFVGDRQAPVQLTVSAHTIENNTETTNDTGSSDGSGESTLNDQQKEKNMSLWLPVSAGLMMIIIMVAVCTWKWKNRSAEDKKLMKNNAPDTVTVEETVIYSTINDENPNNISQLQFKANTIYSSMEDPAECEGQSPAGGTVYSTVAPH